MASVVVAELMAGSMWEAQHTDPVWRERSDFVIAAEVSGGDIATEQLFARQVGPDRFELCCIPFFLYDFALGDVVETDATYMVRRVIEPSGRFVFRVWFGDTVHPRDEIAEQLAGLGALLEWSSVNLLAVDAEDREHAQKIADYLSEMEAAGKLMFETGRSR